jgi:hypothetical protein
MIRLKQDLIHCQNDFRKKITELNIFYANTAQLMSDFLES